MTIVELVGAVVGSVFLFSVVLLFGWMVYEIVRAWVTSRPNRFRAWASHVEARVARGPRLIKWPYFFLKWTLAAVVAASLITKAIDEVRLGQPGAGVAFVVGVPVSFLIHFLDSLAKVHHRDTP